MPLSSTLNIIQDTALKLDTCASQLLPATHEVTITNGRRFGLQADLDKSLASGLPIVIDILHHGSVEAPSGGHMVVAVGRTASGDYIIHDPYGDLMSD